MSSERPISYENPRTAFSFFSEKSKQEELSRVITSVGLLGNIHSEPKMTVQFLYEFWRTGKEQVVYSALKEDRQEFMSDLILSNKFPVPLAFAIAFKGESLANCTAFLKDTFTIYTKVGTVSPLDRQLGPETEKLIDMMVGDILGDVNYLVDQHNAKKN